MPKEGGMYYGTAKLPFGDGIIALEYPHKLFPNTRTGHGVWCNIEYEDEFDDITRWCKEREKYVYMKDCTTASMALEFYMLDNTSGRYTETGELVRSAKYDKNLSPENKAKCIQKLADLSLLCMNLHPKAYSSIDYICSVPSDKEKEFYVPGEITKVLSKALDVEDITRCFSYAGTKKQLKAVPDSGDAAAEKLQILRDAKLSFRGTDIHGKTILLIDGLYKSGVTMQYVAL